MLQRLFLLVLALAATQSAVVVPPAGALPADGKNVVPLNVAVTVVPHRWLVNAVGGERVRVAVAVAPGESPETFQPSDAEASRLLRSRIYFRVGVPAEHGPWFAALARRVRVVDLAGSSGHGDHHHHGDDDHHHGDGDPHSWLDPRLLIEQAKIVAAALEEEDPAGRQIYASRLAELEAELRRLDRELRDQLAPHAGRAFLIYHPAWGHFAEAYGLRQLAIEIDGKTPSDAELTAVRRQAKEERCRVVYVQPQISDRVARLVARSIDARLETLDPLAEDVPANLRAAAAALVEGFEAP